MKPPKSTAQIFGRSFAYHTAYAFRAITITCVFGITYGLKVFDVIYVLTNGGPGRATEVMTTYSYQLYAQGIMAVHRDEPL